MVIPNVPNVPNSLYKCEFAESGEDLKSVSMT